MSDLTDIRPIQVAQQIDSRRQRDNPQVLFPHQSSVTGTAGQLIFIIFITGFILDGQFLLFFCKSKNPQSGSIQIHVWKKRGLGWVGLGFLTWLFPSRSSTVSFSRTLGSIMLETFSVCVREREVLAMEPLTRPDHTI
jgi:hypothetical protein